MEREIPIPNYDAEQHEDDNPSYGSREASEAYRKTLAEDLAKLRKDESKSKEEPKEKLLKDDPRWNALKKKLGTKPPSPTR